MLDSATEHYRRQQALTALGLRAARKARRKGVLEVAKVVTAYQLAVALDARDSVPLMLEEQHIDAAPAAEPVVQSVAGVASDGRQLDTLFDQATTDYRFGLMVVTQLQDAARSMAGLSIATRPGIGYVRMLNPPSCSRCAILAGQFYRWNKGFERHPRCDCRHVPSTEDSGDLTTNPSLYFDSLTEAEQNRIFTNAGAQAIRDGADISKVVNARRGMSTAQINPGGPWIPKGRLAAVDIGGRPVYVTTESTTRRGQAYRGRTGRNMQARLMPESIYANARSREDALRMLRLHGYVI